MTELSKQNRNYKIRKILIVGEGATGTRFFLENLSEVLSQKLKSQNVETTYAFLGYREEIEKKLNNLLKKETYDAVLRFKPKGEEENPNVVDTYAGGTATTYFTVQTVSVRFTQDFTLSLFSKGTSGASLWEGSLTTNLDSRQQKFYTRIAADILKRLQGDYL